jgi:hypothetical protein
MIEEPAYDTSSLKCPYSLLGRSFSHTGGVVGVEFGYREDPLQGSVETLISVGVDRRSIPSDLHM